MPSGNNDESDSDSSENGDSLRSFHMQRGDPVEKKEAEAMINTILHKPKPRWVL